MNNLNEALILVGIGFSLAVFTYASFKIAMHLYAKIQLERAYNKHPRIVPYDQERACKDPHIWQMVSLLMRGIDHGPHEICLKCGAIAGNATDMVSQEAVEQAREKVQLVEEQREFQKHLDDRIAAMTDARVAQYINIKFHKEVSDPTFANALMELADFAVESRKQSTLQVEAEMGAEGYVDGDEFDGWATDGEGNA